jgi:EAL domain-containing protein (putative c-di-GMP-specific phosphodiesterase class I)
LRAGDESEGDGTEGGHRTVVARLTGDEFVVILTGVEDDLAVALVASRIQATLSVPFAFQRHRFVITPSIGIALFPRDGQSSHALLSSADAAMHRAKAEGRNGYRFYSTAMQARPLERLKLESALRSAIQNEQLCLVYQPKVDLTTWSVVGVEALLRWRHPSRGWISPTEFIPIAEETGLIVALGEWVIDKVCRQLEDWQAKGLDINIAINVSGEQFRAADFANLVLQAARKRGVRPGNLELEITESLLMRNVDETIAALTAVREAGIRVSVDDFGTGYSSLSYLKDFPLDSVKIDRSFVRDLHESKDDAAICAAIIAMARELNLKIIAEGVESEEQLEFLRRQGCDQIQGFIFSKPLLPAALEKLLEFPGPA